MADRYFNMYKLKFIFGKTEKILGSIWIRWEPDRFVWVALFELKIITFQLIAISVWQYHLFYS